MALKRCVNPRKPRPHAVHDGGVVAGGVAGADENAGGGKARDRGHGPFISGASVTIVRPSSQRREDVDILVLDRAHIGGVVDALSFRD